MNKLNLGSVSVLFAVRFESSFHSCFLFLRFLLFFFIIELLISVLVLWCFSIFFPYIFFPASDKLLLAWREMEQAVELCGRVGDSF